MTNEEAFQRALESDPCAVHEGHERGCVLRYGAVPEGGEDHPYIKNPETCPCHGGTEVRMTKQYSTDELRSLLDVLGGQSEYRGAVLDFLGYVDLTVSPQVEPTANPRRWIDFLTLNLPCRCTSTTEGAFVCERCEISAALIRQAEPGDERAIDRAYYSGAQQAAAMAHQSLKAMDEWIASGCGGRGAPILPPNRQAHLQQVLKHEVTQALERIDKAGRNGYQVFVQANIVNPGVGVPEYPACLGKIAYGPIFDTRDAALLSMQDRGWMPSWWEIRAVNRG